MASRAPALAAETFTLTLGSAVPADELEAWFRAAEPGARQVYASGGVLLAEARSVKLAWRLANEGKAELAQDRDPERPGCRRWWIQKRRADTARAPRVRGVERRELDALFALLERCATTGRECPSDGAVAEALDLGPRPRGRNRAQYLFGKLKAAGRIAVESRGTCAARVVTILTGRHAGRRTK